MHLIHLIYQTLQFTLAYLKCAQKTYLSLKSSKCKAYFIIKCWISHVIYWILYWKWKNRMVLWVQNGCKCIDCLPLWLRGWLRAVVSCHCPASWESIVLPIANLGKDQNSKFEVWFLLSVYHFCTFVKLKKCKLTIVSWGPSVMSFLSNYLGILYIFAVLQFYSSVFRCGFLLFNLLEVIRPPKYMDWCLSSVWKHLCNFLL